MTRDGKPHNNYEITQTGTSKRTFWVLRCECGWALHSGRPMDEEDGLVSHNIHARDMATPLQLGEEVLVATLDVVSTFERDGITWLTLYNSYEPKYTIEVPESWCDRAGPTPKLETKIDVPQESLGLSSP